MRSSAAFALAALFASGLARAQSVYVDLGPAGVHGAPMAPFAAAAGIAGVWNEIDTASIAAGPFPVSVPNLVDLTGAPTQVRVFFFDLGTGFEGFSYDDAATSGGDDALLDDLGYFNGGALLALRGLAPGNYELFTYASVPDRQDHVTRVSMSSSPDPAQDVTGGFPGSYVQGVTHARHRFTAVAGVDVTFRLDVVRGFMCLNGFQVLAEGATGPLGTRYCTPAQLNSFGIAAEISALGSRSVAANDVSLRAASLPPNTFGYFLTSRDRGFVLSPGGSQGNLCLGGGIGRYRGAGQVQNSGAAGAFTLAIDLTRTPTPSGLVAIAPGETWHFQCWYRDSLLGFPSSNFTDGLTVVFQ